VEETRDKTEKLRFTISELESIKSRVPDGETRSGWIRRVLLNEPIPKTRARLTAPEVSPQLMRELGKMGGNLNQIARALNIANKEGDVITTVEILSILKTMERHLEEIKTDNRRKPSVCKGI
jgi:hypothetical protein